MEVFEKNLAALLIVRERAATPDGAQATAALKAEGLKNLCMMTEIQVLMVGRGSERSFSVPQICFKS